MANHERDLACSPVTSSTVSQSPEMSSLNISGVSNSTFNINIENKISQTHRQKYLYDRIHTVQEVFVSTAGYVYAREYLKSERQLILLGAPGSGKTSMSLMLLRAYTKKNYDVHFIESVNDFDVVNDVDTDNSNLLVFDDIFGKSGLCDSERWLRVLYKLDIMFDKYRLTRPSNSPRTGSQTEESLDIPDLKVIFTSRSNIYKEAQFLLGTYQKTLMKPINVVDLSKRLLDKNEKTKMLSKYKKVRDVALPDDIIESIAKLPDNIVGFPCMCDMFFKMSEFRKEPLKFFSQPMEYLVNSLKERLLSKKSPGQASALVLTVLGDGKLSLPDLDTESDQWKTKWEKCLKQYMHIMSQIPVEIKDGATFLEGTFLSVSSGVHAFSHPTVYDAVAFIMAEKDINFVFNYCSMHFILERVKVQNKEAQQTNTDSYDFSIHVGTDYLTRFVCRLSEELNERNFSVAFRHEAFQQEKIVDDVFAKVNNVEELFHSTDKTDGQSFLFWATFSSAPYLVQKSFANTTFNPNELLEGFLGCSISGNIRALDMIIKHSNSILDQVVSATIADILHTGSDVDILMKNLSVTSDQSHTSDHSHIRDTQNRWFGEQNDCLIHVASFHAHTDIVRRLLELRCDVNCRGELGRTPLMYASRAGHHEVVDALLIAGADLNLMDEERACAFHLAARGGHVAVMKIFIENGVDINKRGEHDRTPLLYACRYGYSDCVKLCLENGGDIKIKCDTDSCLHLACISGSLKTVQILVEHKMDIEELGQFGRTPIMYACRHGNIEIVNYLKKKGANPKFRDERGEDCFHLSVVSGNVEMAMAMLPSSANEHSVCSNNGNSPFTKAAGLGHYEMLKNFIYNDKELVPLSPCFISACFKGHMPIIRMLLEIVEINKTAIKGRTALMTACLGGQIQTATFLISKCADIKLIDEYGNNCWHYACDNGTLDLVKLFLKNGFTVQSPCQNGMTPLMVSCRRNHQELFEFLLEKDRDAINIVDEYGSNCLHHCCVGKHDCPVLVKRLLDLGLDIDSRDNSLKTPAMQACRNGLKDILHCLSDHGADLKLTDNKNQNCLHYASLFDDEDNISFLIHRGVDFNSEDNKNITPLMLACLKGKPAAVKVLLRLGADVTKTNSYDKTCVHLAMESNNMDVLQVLVDHHVDMEMKGKFGRTPFMYACQNGNMDVVEKLIGLKVNIFAIDDNGANSLHLSCMGKTDDCSVAGKLIEIGIEVNSRDQHGMTPVMHACTHGHMELFDFLFLKGANIALNDSRGKNCRDFALKKGHTELAKKINVFLRSVYSSFKRGNRSGY